MDAQFHTSITSQHPSWMSNHHFIDLEAPKHSITVYQVNMTKIEIFFCSLLFVLLWMLKFNLGALSVCFLRIFHLQGRLTAEHDLK